MRSTGREFVIGLLATAVAATALLCGAASSRADSSALDPASRTTSRVSQDDRDDPATRDALDRLSTARARAADDRRSAGVRLDALREAIAIRASILERTRIDVGQPGADRASLLLDQAEDILLRKLSATRADVVAIHAHADSPSPPELRSDAEQASRAVREARALVDRLLAPDRIDELPEIARDRLTRFERERRLPLLEGVERLIAGSLDDDDRAIGEAGEILSRHEAALAPADPEDASDARVRLHALTARWAMRAALRRSDVDEAERFRAIVGQSIDPLDALVLSMLRGGFSVGVNAVRTADLAEPPARRLLRADVVETRARANERGRAWIALLVQDAAVVESSIRTALARRLVRLGPLADAHPVSATRTLAIAIAHAQLAVLEAEDDAERLSARTSLRSTLDAIGDDDTDRALRSLALERLARLDLAVGDRPAARETLARLAERTDDRWGLVGIERLVAIRATELSDDPPSEREDSRVALLETLEFAVDAYPSAPDRDRWAITLARLHQDRDEFDAALDAYGKVAGGTDDALGAQALLARAEILCQRAVEGADARSTRTEIDELAAALRTISARHDAPQSLRGYTAGIALAGIAAGVPDAVRSDDDERTRLIANDEALPLGVRVRALVLRHRVRAADTALRGRVRADREDLDAAISLARASDDPAAIIAVGRELQASMERWRIDRDAGRVRLAEAWAEEMIEPLALVLDDLADDRVPLRVRLDLAEALLAIDRPARALARYDEISAAAPGTLDALLGRAEALYARGDPNDLAEAMRLFTRIGASGRDTSPPPDWWWLAELRQLQILIRVGRSLDRIGPRVERLRRIDPTFGGPRFRAAFQGLDPD